MQRERISARVTPVSPIRKAYHKAVFRQQERMQEPDHCFSCPGRKREEAIAVQLITTDKLKELGIAHCTDFEDISNAFGSISHDKIEESMRIEVAERVEGAVAIKARQDSEILKLHLEGSL